MAVRGNSRYTPPKPRALKTPARDAALKNKVMGLGALNTGDSPTARAAQNAAFDQMERVRAFDQNVAPGLSSRTGRAPGMQGRMVPGLGSSSGAPSVGNRAAGTGYGSLVSKHQAGMTGRASQSGRMGRLPGANMATQTRGFGPAALGLTAPLGLPAAGQSMASPAGTGYGSIVTRGEVQRNSEQLRARAAARSSAARSSAVDSSVSRTGTALERYRGGVPAVRPVGSGAGPVDDAVRDIPKILNGGKKGSIMNNKGLMIGLGAAVIAGLAMNRRGDGTSSGKSSMRNY